MNPVAMASINPPKEYWPSPGIKPGTSSGRSPLKTKWEKEKMLITGIFHFCHNVFYLWGKKQFFQPLENFHLQMLSPRKMLNFCQLVNPFLNKPWFFMCRQSKSLENIVGKGEIAQNKQFLLFPQCFVSVWKRVKFVIWERVEYENAVYKCF